MSKKQNDRNPVAKHAEKFNKSQTFLDRKKEMKKGDYDSIDFDIEEIEMPDNLSEEDESHYVKGGFFYE